MCEGVAAGLMPGAKVTVLGDGESIIAGDHSWDALSMAQERH